MMLDGLYQEIILDHYKNPHGRGLRDPFDGEAHHVNPTCGDEITVRVSSDLSEISYDGLGCSISQASASVLHELLQGKDRHDAAEIHHAFVELMQSRGQVEPDEDVLGDGIAFAGVAKFPARVKCALLPWMAFKDAAARAGVDVGASPEVKA
ncbi:SUF system NifU family Fe-S cluster assembly protein [Actinoplanes oblitus]|uniref:Nitrogen fixation NifU-like protein n=2 Tax=Actinoplanes TaxID=1865 RepID=A0A7W7M7L3_9ACTN|nr:MULTISPECIES: SUF system NifU family Fe-S cluster assembly protein [Actinoplanes]MBB4739935.1 nitrogen fixation NifU-like protein [Actinoplanes octamycinicus]WIM98244.1 SUF system NifU family Fe-S cluster assembly protein [Actinoplanes oblitus]GIE55121.1 iron-sulfur cluster assembly scaffold protein NifU [Actinoplanes octamycinicus]